MADAAEFVQTIGNFHRLSRVDQTLVLAWFLHVQEGLEEFSPGRLRETFRAAGADAPDLSVYLPRLTAKKPPQLLQRGLNIRLDGRERRRLDARLGQHPTTVAVTTILSSLPAKLPSVTERDFLDETLRCYRVRAFRAAIIMAWNLAFDHLRTWLLADSDRLNTFNRGVATKYPKRSLTITRLEDFEDLKEFEVVEALKVSGLVSDNIVGVLREKLGRRNRVAHPSVLEVTQHNADDAITDLVNNVVLVLR